MSEFRKLVSYACELLKINLKGFIARGFLHYLSGFIIGSPLLIKKRIQLLNPELNIHDGAILIGSAQTINYEFVKNSNLFKASLNTSLFLKLVVDLNLFEYAPESHWRSAVAFALASMQNQLLAKQIIITNVKSLPVHEAELIAYLPSSTIILREFYLFNVPPIGSSRVISVLTSLFNISGYSYANLFVRSSLVRAILLLYAMGFRKLYLTGFTHNDESSCNAHFFDDSQTFIYNVLSAFSRVFLHTGDNGSTHKTNDPTANPWTNKRVLNLVLGQLKDLHIVYI